MILFKIVVTLIVVLIYLQLIDATLPERVKHGDGYSIFIIVIAFIATIIFMLIPIMLVMWWR